MNGKLLSFMMTILMLASALAGCAGNDVSWMVMTEATSTLPMSITIEC